MGSSSLQEAPYTLRHPFPVNEKGQCSLPAGWDPWILSSIRSLRHTQKHERFYFTNTLTHKEPVKGKQTKAQANCSANTHLSKMTKSSRRKPVKHTFEMIDLLIWHRWAWLTFKMSLVQSWHHWWATAAEPRGLRHWKCSSNPVVSFMETPNTISPSPKQN